jgi:bifunctional non-homologous end joining protein LigD
MTDTITTTKTLSGIFPPWRYPPRALFSGNVSARSSRQAAFIEPCLPRPAKQPPAGSGWIHAIKHDGFRIIARRIEGLLLLLTRKRNDFSSRFPQIVAALATLPVRSCVIDGEAIVCNEKGLAVFDLIRRQ